MWTTSLAISSCSPAVTECRARRALCASPSTATAMWSPRPTRPRAPGRGRSNGSTGATRCPGSRVHREPVSLSMPTGTSSRRATPPAGLSGVSCPSSSLCVAVDGAGDVVTSVAPTAGAHAWAVTNVDGLNALSAVSCPSTSLCVAVDRAGNVVSSTDPGAGAAVWTVTSVDQTVTPSGSAASLVDVSCSSESLCVAADDAGNVVTSTNPTGGASAWTVADIDGTTALTSVACRASRFCIVVDGTEILTSSDPAGGVPAWSATGNGIELSRVWCPSAALCVGGEASGEMATTLDATASVWTTDNIGLRSLTGLACASALLCAAVDANGNAVVGNPAGERPQTDVVG